ncbi:hypothetical protein CEXT_190931 [Caerostris extrusa]|uniref:Secreted protein n=1 Tax=Caerostris extrusa TaxID=172846 RepID=A0AAV4QJW5_CAEEX|nr:hypothetical protein CEXT_190931 [Caerostris extrusa]
MSKSINRTSPAQALMLLLLRVRCELLPVHQPARIAEGHPIQIGMRSAETARRRQQQVFHHPETPSRSRSESTCDRQQVSWEASQVNGKLVFFFGA